MKKKGILQSMVIKEPLKIDYDTISVEELVEQLQYAIEHPSHLKVLSEKELKKLEALDKQREYDYKGDE